MIKNVINPMNNPVKLFDVKKSIFYPLCFCKNIKIFIIRDNWAWINNKFSLFFH